MSLQESGEMYLESIYVLSKTKSNIRSIDVCEYMGFSKPSVSRAIRLLKEGEYLSVDEDGIIKLTKLGKSIAKKIYERHVLISDFLISIGVDEKTAVSDACKIEHDISDKSFKALKKLMERKNETTDY